jgi:hypothetical protein
MEPRTCSQCGISFETYPSEPGRFCSIACRDAARHAARQVQICTQCGMNFHKAASRMPKSGNRFCSETCYGKWKRGRNSANELVHEQRPVDEEGRIHLACESCGSDFSVPHHAVVGRLPVPRFCSLACSGKAKRKGISGDPVTRQRALEIFAWRQSLGWKKFSTAWTRSHPACSSCGTQKVGRNLVIHHPVDPNATRDETLLFAPSNLVVLCRSCHASLRHPTP